MRILQLIDTLNAGGAERMAVNIANLLYSQKIDTHLVVTYQQGQLSEYIHPGIPIHTLHKRSALDLFAFYRLIRLVIAVQPTHIHAHSTSIVWAAAIKLLFPSITLIWHDHFGLNTQQQPRNYMKWVSLCIDHIICVKTELVEWAGKNLFTHSVEYLPNFSNIVVREQLKITGRVVCIANIRRQKDLVTLINASEILMTRGVLFHIRISGEVIDKAYLNELNHLIVQKGVQNYVTYCGPITDVAEELASAEIGVLSSSSEGLPVALLEYGLASLPVIITDVGECKKIIQNSQNGILIHPGESLPFADAMEYMLNHRKEAVTMGKNLYQTITSAYGEETFWRFYSSLLKK